MRRVREVPIRSNPIFSVVVDGDCEVWYLQMLKRNERSLTVNIEPKIPQRKSLLSQFEIVRELSKEYTKVFWIIDFDVVLKETRQTKKGEKTALQSFKEYLKVIKNENKNVVVIVNNPCIEFWHLLHFETTSKCFENCKAVEKELKKSLKDYEKSKNYYTKQDNDIYLKLKPLLNTAILNAKKLGRFSNDDPYRGLSEMQLFFEAKEFGNYFKKK